MAFSNEPIVRNCTTSQYNIHLAVHPFWSECFYMMLGPGKYGLLSDLPPMPEWQRRMADALWDALPGLNRLFFRNGQITIQHVGLFPDGAISAEAERIILPFLQQESALRKLLAPDPTPPVGRAP